MGTVYVLNISDIQTIWKTMLLFCALQITANPPFVGGSMMSATQKKEAVGVFGKIRLANSLDYVCAWYFIASRFIYGTEIKVAFVSTNSNNHAGAAPAQIGMKTGRRKIARFLVKYA